MSLNHSPFAPSAWASALPRLALRLVGLLALVWLAQATLATVLGHLGDQQTIGPQPMPIMALALILLGYAVLLAVPFMPGVEIGLAVLMLGGAAAAPFVYLATVLGLMLAFLVGWLIPLKGLQHLFRDLRLFRASDWITTLPHTPPDRRLARLRKGLPVWLAPLAVRYRYLSLAVLINLPGNIALGGGGGILMLAGLSRLFHPLAVLAMLALAVAPVPLAVWAMGTGVLP